MGGHEGSGFDGAHKKRRSSNVARRPRPKGFSPVEHRDNVLSSLSMSSTSGSRSLLPDENASCPDGGLRRREFHLNAPLESATEGGLTSLRKTSGNNTSRSESSHGAHVPEGNNESPSTRDKPKRVKLKIGGLSHNVLTKPYHEISDSRSSPAKPPQTVDLRHRQKHVDQTEGSPVSGMLTYSRDKKTKKEKSIEEALAHEQPTKILRESSSGPVRKSRRLAKKSVLESEIDEDYDTSNLEKLGTPEEVEGARNKGGSSSKKNVSKKAKSRSKVPEVDNDFVTSRPGIDSKKRSGESTDDYNSHEEPTSDSELDDDNNQEAITESPANVPLTTRQRALQSYMDGSSKSAVEFPDGLPLAPSRSKKDKLSEEEMLAKKAEAAQRRKMQLEKATKESEAEAIRKILGLDSEKKKEERKQKEREVKERAIRAQNLAKNCIRWVMGPTGTIVSFPEEVGLPSIFNSKPHSYPPPREKCVGPSCTKAYRYRHSKLNLPLCSLECYKAVDGNS